jgi:protein-disulfide isomerase
MKMKELGIWIGIIVILFATFWGLITLVNSSNPSTNSTVQTTQTKPPASISAQDITLGATNSAKVIVIEYADFQCPACKAPSGFLKRAAKDFKDKVLVAYRFFPLINSHQNAMSSAQTAFAAHKQNRFWEMSEMLYQNQDTWANLKNPQQIFTDYAKKLSLSIDQFTSDYSADSTRKFINVEEDEGIAIGINFTPSFFVNGKLIETPQNYEAFKQIIQNEINTK